MPFTPFHLGPALAIGVPAKKYMHAPTFILANAVLDIEPLLVLVLGLKYPLHGYLHTVVLAVVVGAILGFGMFRLQRVFSPFFRAVQLESSIPLKLQAFLIAGFSGAVLHVLIDALLYSEMHPFFPYPPNPLLNVGASMSEVYLACIWLGIFGFAYYLVTLGYSTFKKTRKN